MNSNEEFSKFISGTTFGNENYEKWQRLLSLISNDLYQAMLNLNNATSIFLERQEQYNSSSSFENAGGGNGEVYEVINKTYSGKSEQIYDTPGFRVDPSDFPVYTS